MKSYTLEQAKQEMKSKERKSFKRMLLPPNCGNAVGMYSLSQAHAKQLAIEVSFPVVVLKDPEVQAPGYYGHYHDFNHEYHFWYGFPINY